MIYMILFIIAEVTCAPKSHVGSVIFYNKQGKYECWDVDELAKLRARRIFEQAMPPSVSPEHINSRYLREMLGYFRHALRNVGKDVDSHSADLLKTALADTIGAHLTKEILSSARFAYYAGYVPYKNVKELHDILEQVKLLLNTQGLGWARPDRIPQWTNLTVVKVFVGQGKLVNACASLVIKKDTNSCIHLPVPKLDDKYEPSAIALPFKRGGLISLVSPRSENILLKYYTTASRCILRNSPETCRHSDFLNFNNEMWHWMKRDVAPHLVDAKLYAAYGGVLRIAAAVQSYGKGLTRRNLFDNDDDGISKWHPWKGLSGTYLYMDPDWTPKLYIILIIFAAGVICLSQICYSFIFGNSTGCHCSAHPQKNTEYKDVAYSRAESIIPSLLPPHQTSVYYSEDTRLRSKQISKKTSSHNSMRSQRVFDLHENTEKTMAVIMSDNEETSETDSSSPSKAEVNRGPVPLGCDAKAINSPPKIETSISQLKIEKKTNPERSRVFSTSTTSEMTYCREHEDTGSPWTGTSISEQSVTSASSKSQCRKSRNSRDLAWAHRVAYRASKTNLIPSATDLDVNSFRTPPSKH